MNAMTPMLHMSVARLSGSKFTTSGATQNNSSLTNKPPSRPKEKSWTVIRINWLCTQQLLNHNILTMWVHAHIGNYVRKLFRKNYYYIRKLFIVAEVKVTSSTTINCYVTARKIRQTKNSITPQKLWLLCTHSASKSILPSFTFNAMKSQASLKMVL